jgi:hypothetical protein
MLGGRNTDSRYKNQAISPESNDGEYEMKNETFTGTIENFYGKPVSPALTYEATVEKFETIDEVKSKNEYPSDSEIVDFINAKRKANARQKAMQVAADGAGLVKPTLENDGQLRLKSMYKILIASGKSESEARELASTVVGETWAE